RPVVDRLPAFITPRRVVDLPLRELPRIPRDDLVHQGERVLAAYEILLQRRDVEHSRRMPDREELHLRHERIRGRCKVSLPVAPLPALATPPPPELTEQPKADDSASR